MTAHEAEAAFTGTWSGLYTGAQGGTVTLTLRMVNPPIATKCASQTLSTKCSSMTSVRLVGTLTTSDGTFTATDVTASVGFGDNAVLGTMRVLTATKSVAGGSYQDGTFQGGVVELATGRASFTVLRRK